MTMTNSIKNDAIKLMTMMKMTMMIGWPSQCTFFLTSDQAEVKMGIDPVGVNHLTTNWTLSCKRKKIDSNWYSSNRIAIIATATSEGTWLNSQNSYSWINGGSCVPQSTTQSTSNVYRTTWGSRPCATALHRLVTLSSLLGPPWTCFGSGDVGGDSSMTRTSLAMFALLSHATGDMPIFCLLELLLGVCIWRFTCEPDN